MRRSFQQGVHEVGSGIEIIRVFVVAVDAGGSGTSCTERRKKKKKEEGCGVFGLFSLGVACNPGLIFES